MAERAPRYKTDRSSDEAASFAAAAGNGVNLQTLPLRMPFGPQRMLVIGGVAAGAATLTMEDDSTLVVPVQPGQNVPVTTPVKAIVTNTDCALICEWWTAPGPGDFQHGPYTRNPAP